MSNNPLSFPADGIVKIEDICAFLRTTRQTWYRKIREGKAPSPFKLFGSPKMSRWNAADIHAIKARWDNVG